MWVAIASLRNSYSELIRYLEDWLGARARFEDFQGPVRILRKFWSLVGLKETFVEQLVTMQIRFQDGRLVLHSRCAHEADWPDRVVSIMQRLWSFSTWSTSRWCRAGQCCHALLGSLFVGFGDYTEGFAFAAGPPGSDGLVGRMAGWLAGGSVGWLAGWLASCLVCWVAGWLVGWLVSVLVAELAWRSWAGQLRGE